MKTTVSARLTLVCNRIIAVGVAALLPGLPFLLNWYRKLRPLGTASCWAILIGFYCCAPLVFWALWDLDGLLRAIGRGEVFVPANVRRIRRVGRCCAGVCVICLPAAVFYPPLVFLTVIMAFLTLVVRVIAAVMDAAVTIREENDLTI